MSDEHDAPDVGLANALPIALVAFWVPLVIILWWVL